ncbi:serine/threonine protein kinase [Gigaspora margarita]|uniref:Serine/threonine protein kinase n=1 Tax=Gigaspora margarita TaxID=4874 RepID=A0A8H4AVZ3_GIGMA|nr:serine/threonine protein kinase [Gigaspora margarita]
MESFSSKNSKANKMRYSGTGKKVKPHLFKKSSFDCDIEYSELKKLNRLAVGGFGIVYLVQWNKGKENEQIAAAKFIKYDETQQFERDFGREVNSLRHSKDCKEHIVQFFGLSQDCDTNEYILVMQYANNGNLRDYLKNDKNMLQLSDKIVLNKSILKGLQFLHSKNIIHRDLHSKNVLIHNGNALLADFGLSKSLLETNDGHTSEVRGVQVYVDPLLLDKTFNPRFTHTELSDIYSFGVLMWEIYTRRQPFDGRNDKNLTLELCFGMRERRIEGMPLSYCSIYEKCWDKDPAFRPKFTQVLNDLENLRPIPKYHEDIDNLLTDEITIESFGKKHINIPEIFIQNEDGTLQIINSIPTTNLERPISLNTFLLQPFKEAHQLFEDTRKSCENVQINKKICKLLLKRINLAEYNVNQTQTNNHVIFTISEYYKLFQKFLQNIKDIKIFIENISHIRGLKQYVQRTHSGISLEKLENKFIELLNKFNECTSSLEFRTMKLEIENIHNEIEETTEFIQAIQHNFKADMFKNIEEITIRLTKQSSFTDELFNKLVKSVNEIKCDKHAICKHYDLQEKQMIYAQAVILKNLGDSTNIIKFYGIVKNESSLYLVIEWAGSLKEYIRNKNNEFNLQKKLQFALDICNGLVFLKAVNILHRDIRSESIIITSNHQAKISNFDNSQLTSDASYLGINRNNIEYLAPEILERENHYSSYDFRCEVYSFGILLWELSNAETPYENYNNEHELGTLKDMILRDKNYNLSNSINSCMAQEYKDIVIQALDFEPINRPTICEMFKVLYSLANNDRQKNSHNDYLRISSNIFSQSISFFEFSSIEDAINETKKLGGDKLRAWKYFDTHSNLDVPLACYWKGYFLYNNILGEPESKSNERIKEAAQLFKVASEANIGDAQYKYAECLWKGEGVNKDQRLAVEIFRKAADNDNVNAKYCLGKIYYEGLSGIEDKEEGAYYLKLAAYENYEAREYCIKCNIDLNDF